MADFDLFNYANKNHLFSVDIMFILFTIEVLLLHSTETALLRVYSDIVTTIGEDFCANVLGTLHV